jgi:WD40 repeat protein
VGGHGVEQLAFSADGATLILLSGGETHLRRLNVETGAQLAPLAGPLGKLLGFTLAADGRRLLTHGADGAVRLIDLADGDGRTLAGHTQPITGTGFAAGGRTIVTLGLEGTLRVWPDDLPETMPELRAWLEAATPER